MRDLQVGHGMDHAKPNRDQRELAKQLRTYADATTAFSVIQSIAFSIALGSKDLGENIRETNECLIPILCCVALGVYICIIAACHAGENALVGKPFSSSSIHRWTKYVRWGRYFVTILAEGVVFVGIYYTRYGSHS
jgi:hypothetical protein